MKRRKHATYRCPGAGCANQVRLRVPAKRGPKRKPQGWTLTRAYRQEADTGILRETSFAFCSPGCLRSPAESGDLVASIHSYLGPPCDPPDLVTYRCCGCDKTAELTRPQHRNNEPALPEGWEGIPLMSVDYDSGVSRITTIPACSEACLERLDEIDENAKDDSELPQVVQDEIKRVVAGIAFDWDHPVREPSHA